MYLQKNFQLFDRKPLNQDGYKLLYYLIIGSCNNNVININKKIENLTTSIEYKKGGINMRVHKARGNKELVEFVIPNT